MANRDYDLTINKILRGQINFQSVELEAYLVNLSGAGTVYTPNFSTHEHLSDVPSGARRAGPVPIGSLSLNGRYIDGADVTFPTVAAGDAIEGLLIVIKGANESNSPLLALFDTASGLPAAPDGSDITIRWNASGIWGIAPPAT